MYKNMYNVCHTHCYTPFEIRFGRHISRRSEREREKREDDERKKKEEEEKRLEEEKQRRK